MVYAQRRIRPRKIIWDFEIKRSNLAQTIRPNDSQQKKKKKKREPAE